MNFKADFDVQESIISWANKLDTADEIGTSLKGQYYPWLRDCCDSNLITLSEKHRFVYGILKGEYEKKYKDSKIVNSKLSFCRQAYSALKRAIECNIDIFEKGKTTLQKELTKYKQINTSDWLLKKFVLLADQVCEHRDLERFTCEEISLIKEKITLLRKVFGG
jgi:hypothetical protein